MCFNASDPSGAGGLAGDIATRSAMGAHALPIVTAIVMRDTADVFDQHDIDADAALFGDGLGLDSVDALELGLALQKRFGIKIDAEAKDTREHFANVNRLVAFVAERQAA